MKFLCENKIREAYIAGFTEGASACCGNVGWQPCPKAVEAYVASVMAPKEVTDKPADGTATSSPRERRLCATLRALAVERLNEIDEDAAAEQLGLYPRGVRTLVRQEEWDLETAFRVVDALGFDVAGVMIWILHTCLMAVRQSK